MNNPFHIGKYLTQIIEQKKLKRSEITSLMGVQYSAFYGYENRPSLQYSIVYRLCLAMKYNLFLDIANTLPADFEHNLNLTSAKDDLLKQLQDENQKLKWENDLLKEIIVKKG